MISPAGLNAFGQLPCGGGLEVAAPVFIQLRYGAGSASSPVGPKVSHWGNAGSAGGCTASKLFKVGAVHGEQL